MADAAEISPARALDEAKQRRNLLEGKLSRLQEELEISRDAKRVRALRVEIADTEATLRLADNLVEMAGTVIDDRRERYEAKLAAANKGAGQRLSTVEGLARRIDSTASDIAVLLTELRQELLSLAPLVVEEDLKHLLPRSAVLAALQVAGLEDWIAAPKPVGSARQSMTSIVSTKIRPTVRGEVARLKTKEPVQ
jgi:hypothetical protein